MAKQTIPGGVVHKLPLDLKKALVASPKSLVAWETITPLARNEWICWIESVKQADTRKNHLERAIRELSEGKRRPCCWYGCIHRTDKAVSPSVQKLVIDRQSKKSP